MKKFSFGMLAFAVLAAPSFANDAPVIAPPCPLPVDVGPAECTKECALAHEHGLEGPGASIEVCNEVMMTMTAIPGAEVAVDGNVDPTLMYMTGGPVETADGPTRLQHGDNFRDLGGAQTMTTLSVGTGAKFEGLRQVASERHAFGVDRAGGSDKSSLKSMLFGSKKDTKAKTTLVANERARMQKMAEVDKLRDQALKTGDAKLLKKADAMEKDVKVGGKSSSKFSLFGRK